jgi:squalene-hopene/tetraprenyl-beta-curcumene cyclase
MRNAFLWTCALAVLFPATLHTHLVLAQAPQAQDLAAPWQGTLQPGADQHRIVLQFAKSDAGTWTITHCFVEFLHDDPHVDSLVVDGSHLQLTMDGGKDTYEAQISADGSTIAGTWNFGQHAYPLELHRASAQAAWQVPFQYQYHQGDVTYLRPTATEARIPFNLKLAVDYMEQGAAAWTSDWKCVACHTNGSYMVVRPLLTPELGQPSQKMRDFFVGTLNEELATDPADQRPELDSTQAVYVAAGLAIWDAHVTHRLSPETAEALAMMFKLQRTDGDWTISDDNNPPLESNRYQLATVAARAIGNAPGWLAQQRGTPLQAKIDLLENYLRQERKTQGDYDRVDLLWSSTELPGLLDDARKQQLVDMVLAHQKSDGGWSIRTFATPEEWAKGNRAAKLRAEPEFANPPSDGHMTGLAIIALRKAGVPASDPRIQRGVQWLLANQRASGRWYTRSLNRDGWQFITYSGTLYPLLALDLCNALPPQATHLNKGGL